MLVTHTDLRSVYGGLFKLSEGHQQKLNLELTCVWNRMWMDRHTKSMQPFMI